MRFLFWNLAGQERQSTVAKLVAMHRVDVIGLAECKIDGGELRAELRRATANAFDAIDTGANVRLYLKAGLGAARRVLYGDRYTIQSIDIGDRLPILLAIAHLPSKASGSAESTNEHCTALAFAIRNAEQAEGHRRTVLMGDLNANPYERGFVSALGLHSVPTRTLAAGAHGVGGVRTVQHEEYPIFYNPMWNFFGDETPGPPGTFFRPGSEFVSEFWNMYDQVLVRNDLLDRFAFRDLRILTDDGAARFHTPGGRPSMARASDHFPILFQLR